MIAAFVQFPVQLQAKLFTYCSGENQGGSFYV
jgi:hypothetical protein